MRSDTKAKLDAILDGFEDVRADAAKKQTDAVSRRRQFQTTFLRLRENVIRPVMTEIGRTLAARGHGWAILDRDETFARGQETRDEKIIMRIYPADAEAESIRTGGGPAIAFVAVRSRRRVRIQSQDAGGDSAGGLAIRGEVRLDDLTSDRAEQEIVAVMNEVFRHP